MEKPQAKSELVIKQHGDTLHIWTVTQDAAAWIMREAAPYGILTIPNFPGDFFELWIIPCFDPDEVCAYLNTYGKDGAA